MRNESKPANPGARVRVQKLLLILALACSSSVSVTAVEAAGSAARLQGTAHNNGRGTSKLVLPVPAESKVANNREGAEQFLRRRQAEFKLPADLSNLELVAARESLLGTYYRYRQMLNGIPVDGAEVVVSISPEIVVNKWDAVERTETLTKEFESQVRRRLKFLDYAPLEFISAKYGRRVEKLFPRVDHIAENYRPRFRTARLNEILAKAVVAHHPPAAKGGKQRRFYYAMQLKAAPPTFGLSSNVSDELHFSYRRYLENQFREALGLDGTPIHFVIRGRKGMKDSAGARHDKKDDVRKPTGKPQRVKDAERKAKPRRSIRRASFAVGDWSRG